MNLGSRTFYHPAVDDSPIIGSPIFTVEVIQRFACTAFITDRNAPCGAVSDPRIDLPRVLTN